MEIYIGCRGLVNIFQKKKRGFRFNVSETENKLVHI